MPIDYQQIYTRIKEIGQGTRERKKKKEDAQALARTLLNIHDSQLDGLRSKVNAAKQADSNIRCAVPVNENLTSSYPPPVSVIQPTLIAADGSQSVTTRHDPVQFCVINTGIIIMKLSSGDTPIVETESELFFGDEIEEKGLNTEGGIALKRDLNERTIIEKFSKKITGAIVSFTDGTLEIFRSRDIENTSLYQKTISQYITVLSRLQSKGIITAGYIDKPSSNLMVKLLEIAQATIPDELEKIKNAPPLKYVTDRWLFGYDNNLFQILPAGHRSAIFKIQSSSEKNYTGVLELHFFYLNVGSEGHPWPVRVEIPRWVVDDKEQLDLLHCVLVQQCQMMGSRPYPYLLNRAHEIAVVKNEEKQQIEMLLKMEMHLHNEEIDNPSNKQVGKDSLAAGRKRY